MYHWNRNFIPLQLWIELSTGWCEVALVVLTTACSLALTRLQSVQHFCAAVPDPQTFLWHFGQTAHLQPSVLCLLPSQQTVLIVPSSHFPANYSLHFPLHPVSFPVLLFILYLSSSTSLGYSSCSCCVHVATSMIFCSRECRLSWHITKPGGCWTESRMNESLLEGRASLHQAFAAPDCKGKSIPIKSINSLLSGNNKDFY